MFYGIFNQCRALLCLGRPHDGIKGRFPPVAGYSVEANQCYKIQVMVKIPVTEANPTGEKDLLNGTGIYKFAPRAIVDLEVPYTAG